MAYLGNTPHPGVTVLQLEARKSFAFTLRFVNSRGDATNITGCTVRLVVKTEPLDYSDLDDGDNLIVNSHATIEWPRQGIASFGLQSSDLEHPAGEYPYSIVLLTPDGYSTVVVKGVIELLPNTEFASVSHSYAGANPAQSLEVAMQGSNVIDVRIGSILPPGMNYLTDAERETIYAAATPKGGKIGQALVKASAADLDVKWADVGGGAGGGLFPDGVPAGQVPTSDGNDSWAWTPLPRDAAVEMEIAHLDTFKTTGLYIRSGVHDVGPDKGFPMGGRAGALEVIAFPVTDTTKRVFQRFNPVGDPSIVWSRNFDGASWSPWLAPSIPTHEHKGQDITTGTISKDRIPLVAALRGISSGTAAPPSGGPEGSLYIKYTL